MFRRILVAYDGSAAARAAIRVGIQLAKDPEAELASVSVEESLPRYAATIDEVQEAKEDIDAHARMVTAEAQELARAGGVELETVVRQGHEVEMILALARERRADLLLIGYQGHSRIFERLLGSTALSLARVAACSVLVVRPLEAFPVSGGPFQRILAGLDGSPHGRLALQAAVELARLSGGTVIGLTVQETSPLGVSGGLASGYAQRVQTAAEEHARTAGVPFEGVMRSGHAVQALCDQAEEGQADLIVLGATGLERPWSPTIGGTATGVVSQAPCSVLLVRPPQAALRVRDVMVRAVSSVGEDASLARVVELLLRRNIKALPVVDFRRHVVGIISGGDLLSRGDVGVRLSIQRELPAETWRGQLRDLARGAKTARDVMTHPVYTVEVEADLMAAIRLMARRRVKRLPVVDGEGELIGILSRADVLRALAALPEPTMPAELETQAQAGTVGDVVTTGIPVVSPETSADDVLVKLLECPLRRVVVAEPAGRVLGLISDRDLLVRAGPDLRPWVLRALTGRRPAQRPGEGGKELAGPEGPLTAADLMGPTLFTVHPEDPLVHAIRLMIQHQVKRLVVVDAAGRFVGLVDRRALLRSLVA
jgi:nucleotide-binding universal stress UspA family protein/CBS-domain-containing membrane protein